MPVNNGDNLERLQKYLARSGVASRRASEELIRQGKVTVNDEIVREMGFQIDPAQDRVVVDGKLVEPVQFEYWAVYKPAGYVSTASDTHGRRTVVQLVGGNTRLYPVGRLDVDSEGLMLLTNDGPLAQKLMHPSFQHEKEYLVLVRGDLTNAAIRLLERGVLLEGERTRARARIERLPRDWAWRGHRPVRGDIWAQFVLQQGQKRQIRRMLAEVHCHVQRIVRVRIGTLDLGGLESGGTRRLSADEVASLKKLAGL